MIHLFCQCTLNNFHDKRVVTEFNSSNIDQSLLNIIKLYIKKNPNIESIALYFNNETDAVIARKYGTGTYFTICEFDIFALMNNEKMRSNIPFEYFCVEGKNVYIVSEVNVLFSEEYIKRQAKQNAAIHKLSNTTRYKKWQIKYEEDWSRCPDVKRCYKIIEN